MSEQMKEWLSDRKGEWRQAAGHEQKKFDEIEWNEMSDWMTDM